MEVEVGVDFRRFFDGGALGGFPGGSGALIFLRPRLRVLLGTLGINRAHRKSV